MLRFDRERFFQIIQIILPLLLLILAGVEIQKAISGMNKELLRDVVSQIPNWQIVLIFIISICAITPMFLYDAMLVKLLGIKVRAMRLVKQSFIVNTFSNLVGFGGIAGLILRNYFYAKHDLNKRVLLKNIASVTIFSLTGISLLASVFLLSYRNFSLFDEIGWLFFAVLAVSLFLPSFILFYLVQHQRRTNSSISLAVFVKLVLASLLEWTALFCAIWFFTFVLNIPIGVTDLLPVFIIATCAGIASMIPGGIGSFDLVFIWGTQNLGIIDEKVLALLIFYRISYFVFPFLLSVVLFHKEIIRKTNTLIKKFIEYVFRKN
ncbi:lysylphosphatidylglycerol synthase domain-containing protein [Lederbergia lenta]|uniref:Phosphatidylglycerol lysyltransferase n=1 Tax=Lederbergia lenta TaxID=1467 RepID=A0A2X4VN10_LEDLE|nr:lysylphosphatidylglycerol synthase domain-containing protein [Lederbergia lenta]MCM3112681.1 lysylphosphatidylglycerol synthase domain-containing protein [Lederbergia lenta]MEC2323720.1 lysylphosphatidylglycerol synthase domain-containing protein [Lederbergia lenta]SQI51569.1 factor involved in lysinylation of phospholipids [Lederbergia lenta]